MLHRVRRKGGGALATSDAVHGRDAFPRRPFRGADAYGDARTRRRRVPTKGFAGNADAYGDASLPSAALATSGGGARARAPLTYV